MPRRYKKYDWDFKKRVVEDIENRLLTQAEASRKYSISQPLIIRWRKQVNEGLIDKASNPSEKSLLKELSYYKNKVAELTFEVDMLKKMDEYFRRKKKSDGCVITEKNLEQLKKGAK